MLMHTREAWDEVLRRDLCAYCTGPGGTVDHIVPSSLGGTNRVDNMTGACFACNHAKADRSLLGFLLGVPVNRLSRRVRRLSRRQLLQRIPLSRDYMPALASRPATPIATLGELAGWVVEDTA